jgi:hypothetical protein
VRGQVEDSVRYANINIIEGNEASQFGIGIVAARIEIVGRDERAVIPIGSYRDKFGSRYRFRASSDNAAACKVSNRRCHPRSGKHWKQRVAIGAIEKS